MGETETKIRVISAEQPEAEIIAEAAAALRAGGTVAFPTETVYGLGANALDPDAVGRIFEAKGRPASNPLIVHVADVEAARALVTDWPENAEKLAAKFWPGPLTLVLPRRNVVPDIVTGGGPTVGIRVPAHPVALALLRAAGLPIAAPSANRSTEISPTLAEHVSRSLSGRVEMILDGGPTSGGVESTVLNLTTRYPGLLRPGLVTPAEIEAVVGPIKRRTMGTVPNAEGTPMVSPGQMERHYAPQALLTVNSFGENYRQALYLLQRGRRVGWLTLTEMQPSARYAMQGLLTRLHSVVMPSEPVGYGARLYAALHELDEAEVEFILADTLPENEVWLAVRDRLRRASAK